MVERQILNNRYEIIEEIGGGGMAKVYRADDHFLNREVAIKILRSQHIDDIAFVKRFRQEARSSARLIHPNIVNIYDVGEEDDIYYIVMEYVKGKTLKAFIEEHGKIEPKLATQIAIGVVSALQHAHDRGIIHCDIKPHNILLDEANNPKVADFGIAKAISTATMTYTTSVIGSVHYLSPEQASGEQVSAQSDLYSLGIVLFEMLTGKLPFTADTPIAVALKHVRADMPLIRTFEPDLPLVLEQIVTKALAKKKENRYNSASEFLSDLKCARELLLSENKDQNSNSYELFATSQAAPTKDLCNDETVIIKREDFAPETKTEILDFPVVSPEVKEKLRIKKLQKMAIAAVAFLAVVLTAFTIFGGKEVAVPDVVGKTVGEAQKALAAVNLDYTVIEEFNNKIQPGKVISQNPPGNRMVKEGRKVRIVVSKGIELVSVPNMLGKDLSSAKSALKSAKLELGNVTMRFAKGAPAATILEQSVTAPAKIPVGTAIDLIVNIDKEQVIIPDLKGLTIQDAKNKLNDLGLKLSEVIRVDSEADVDTVVSSNPTVNAVVGLNSNVSINVSKGKGGPKISFVEFVVPSGNNQEVKIVVADDNGRKTIYTNKVKGGSRIRQQVEGVGTVRVQFYCDGRLVEEKRL